MRRRFRHGLRSFVTPLVLTPTALKHLTPKLAAPGPDTAVEVAPPVVVELTGAGELSVNGEATGWEGLRSRVGDRLARSRDGVVFFKIADDVAYGDAIRLMDLCRGAGARVLGVPSGSAG